MDFSSSLSEAGQQQHQQQQQQQQQHQYYYHSSYSYDPTTTQTHSQSYYYQQQQPPQQQQQDFYAYYRPDYSSSYQRPPPHHPWPITGRDDSAPQITDPGGTASYHPTQPSPNAMVPRGLNPAAAAAAVAALSQLTQLAGSMDAAERAMAGLQGNPLGLGPTFGQHPYGGGGRRGVRPLQGCRQGRGSFGHHHRSGHPFRGRGRGRAKAHLRGYQHQGAKSASSHHEPPAAGDTVAEPSADASERAAQLAAPEVTPSHRLPQMPWCDLCRVDCTSLEILEQHKNGKRHKKNLLRIGKSNSATREQNDQEPINDSKLEAAQQPEMAQKNEEQKSTENLPAAAAGDEHRVKNNMQNNTEENPEVPLESSSDPHVKTTGVDRSGNKKRGVKRKIRGGREGKRMNTSGTPRRPIDPSKPKVVIPLICDLCNVKCDTQEVFDRHLAGKKHISKRKRFEGHKAMYGQMGLQALYPPNPIAQSHILPQGQQHFYSPQTAAASSSENVAVMATGQPQIPIIGPENR